MASLMEELITTLNEEDAVYRRLIPVEQEKTRAVIANDLKALEDITEREHNLVDQTSALETRQERIAVDVATVLGMNPKTITLKEIIESLKNQPKDQKELQEVHDRLRRTVHAAAGNKHSKQRIIKRINGYA